MQEPGKAVFKVFIRGRIDDVWREITKTDEVQKCMFDMRLHTPGLKPGAKMQMRSANGKWTGVVGEVLEFDPPRRYAHTFRFTAHDDPPCRISYDLRETEGGVEFTMTFTDLPRGTKSEKQMTQGGRLIVNTLKAVVETGRPSFGVRLLYRLFRLLGPLTPKRCRASNWPL